jgi:hypothetical protein
MEYLISIFLLGCVVSFVVIVGLARAAEFFHAESSQHLQIDPVPPNFDLAPDPNAEGVTAAQPSIALLSRHKL